MKKGIRLNHKGFSLIELIVAILIMAIIGGVTIVAFNAVFSTKTNTAAKTIQDALKQTRIEALGRDNDDQPEPGETVVDYSSSTGFSTNIYTEFYIKDSYIFADACTNKNGSGFALNTSTIGSDNFKLDFCDMDGNVITSLSSSNATNVVRIFFKKSTGGVSRISYTKPTGGKTKSCDCIKVYGPTGEEVDVILVALTGRSYIDLDS